MLSSYSKEGIKRHNMEVESVEEVSCYATGGLGPLDVTRETELAMESFLLQRQVRQLEVSNGKLQSQNQRCETALKKMNALIDEYVRRSRQYDRKLKISQELCEELKKQLNVSESERRQMARTFGKHRTAHERIQDEKDILEEEYRQHREDKDALDTERCATIDQLTRDLASSRDQHSVDMQAATARHSADDAIKSQQAEDIASKQAHIKTLEQELAIAKKTMEDCLNNVEKTPPYLKLATHTTTLQSQLMAMTTRANKLMDQKKHLMSENERVVSFAASEGLEIPALSAIPHANDI